MKKMIVRQEFASGWYRAGDEHGKHGGTGDLVSHAIGAAIAMHPDYWGIEIIREDADGPDGEKQ